MWIALRAEVASDFGGGQTVRMEDHSIGDNSDGAGRHEGGLACAKPNRPPIRIRTIGIRHRPDMPGPLSQTLTMEGKKRESE